MMEGWRPLRAVLLAAACLASAMLVSSCADYTEVDDLYVVTGMAIDTGPRGLRVTVDIVNPDASQSQQTGSTGGGGTSRPDIVVQGDGPTLEWVLHDLQRELPHRLYLSHNAVVILSRDVLSQELPMIMDALERNRQLRRSQMLITTTGRAETLLSTRPQLNKPASLLIRDVVDQSAGYARAISSDELRVIKRWLTPSGVATLAWVETGDDGSARVQGVALVRRDGASKLLGGEDCNGVLWWLGDTHNLRQVVPCPGGKGASAAQGGAATGRTATIRWMWSQTRVRWVGTPDRPVFRVRWTGHGELERWCADEKLDDTAFAALQQLTALQIEAQMRQAWQAMCDADMDGAGLQSIVYRSDPRAYQRLSHQPGWWKQARFEFDVRPQLTRSQLASQSPLSPLTEQSSTAAGTGKLPTK
ncbi:MAG: hypothetical protein IRZ10_11015 [Thermoflavifilum sp.]|nr:hypothetical protein [Thermoflavifilum sp.]MCL6514937.1 hypothetical protein [Alicyclobacillus sp.]